jgi:hypothetical protein
MKRQPIKRRAADELRILAIALIAQQTELMAAAIRGSTDADIDAAIEHAVNFFINRNELPAIAIAQGVQYAKNRIQHREALMLCAVVMINFYIYQ